jgi:prevent-host-death family protein
VGIREVKNGLSRYLKHVKNGESIIITERNKPIAKIVPLDDDLLPEYDTLIKEGTISWSGGKPKGHVGKKKKQDKMISDYVSDDRR